jgi:c-di-GMP-binding flagellar brake protein YcgR
MQMALTPAVGQHIKIRFAREEEQYFRSEVAEHDDEWMYLHMPIDTASSKAAKVAQGTPLWIEYQSYDGCIYRYQSEVVEILYLPMPTLQVYPPSRCTVERDQKREFVRVPVDLPVTLRWLSGEVKQQEVVYSRDLSGGGLALLIPRSVRLTVGQEVYVQFRIPNNSFDVLTQAVVSRVGERNDRGYAVASLQFRGMKESTRQKIIQFTFNRQRMIR